MAVRVAVHAHFYQPPRENPWTGTIDAQPDAAPFHDWNERVHAECYRPNAFVELDGRTLNNFERLSFNVGPTLLGWLEEHHSDTYERILEGDRLSAERLGHGNALAQAFHHTILPLATVRDIRTQIRWGLADFRHRFRREAEGMWLPETAANTAVLSILIEEGVGFTVLAPHQVAEWREPDGVWVSGRDQPVDTRLPYRFLHPDGSGRELVVFFYDGALARDIAFGNLGSSSEAFVESFLSRGNDEGLVHAATDGETYGHHHKFSDIGLAHALFDGLEQRGAEVTNYATFLEQSAARLEFRPPPGPGTSWSCEHGIGRWSDDCGCQTYGPEGWDQRWRAPLRAGLEIIRWAADETFEQVGGSIFVDPWGARDRYVSVALDPSRFPEFLEAETAGLSDERSLQVAVKVLEAQRNAMSMFTSCGWFFYDVARIETVQILRYAARTLDWLSSLGLRLPNDAFMPLLEEAQSNDPEEGTAASILARLMEEEGASASG